MKIKDTLDLCGWELWNFCIQNHQNLEGLLDLGAGRKVFYTGNDQGKNGREVIYDGSKWKVSAYMSDVDELRGLITALENATDEEIEALKGRTTTLEGRVDTIDNMLNVENSQTVVDTWEEVKKFLASVSEETDLITLLNGKANWSGDIAIDDIKSLGYGKNSGTTGWVYNGPAISFGANTTYFAQLQVNFQKDNLVFRRHTNEGFSDWREVLHQGNYENLIGNTYLKTTGGTIASSDFAPLVIVRNDTNGVAVRFENKNGLLGNIGIAPNASGAYPFFGDGTTNHTLAFTDQVLLLDGSNVMGKDAYIAWNTTSEGNDVADWDTVTGNGLKIISSSSANSNAPTPYSTALHVKGRYGFQIGTRGGETSELWFRSLGGQKWCNILHSGNYSDLITTLNGNLRVNGNVTMPNDYGVLSQTSAGNVIQLIGITTANKFYIGTDAVLQNGMPSLFFGKTIDFIVGNSLAERKVAASFDADGNLHVFGNIIADGEVSAGGAGTEGEGGAGGFSLYESWGTSAPTEPLALGANLGYELKTRVEDLELAKTKVTFEPELVSGKQIGTIEIDGNKTNLFAPATYAWSEITGRPVNLSAFNDDIVAGKYLPITGGTITGEQTTILTLTGAKDNQYALLYFKTGDAFRGNVGWGHDRGMSLYNVASNATLGIKDDGTPHYNNNTLLHSGNVGDYALPLTGGTMKDAATINWGGNLVGWDDVSNGFIGISNFMGDPNFGYYVGLSFKGYYGFQIRSYGGSELYEVRGHNSSNWGTWRTLLHSGNIGDYALKTDGSNVMNRGIKWTKGDSLTAEDSAVNTGLRLFDYTESSIIPNSSIYNSVLSAMSGYSGFQIAVYGGDAVNPMFRKYNANTREWSDWKTIAFTDSNVASAQALIHSNGTVGATAQSSGIVSFASHIVPNNDSQSYVGVANKAWYAVYTNGLWAPSGKTLYLGANNSNHIIINSSGNVGIGVINPTHKLDVYGRVKILNSLTGLGKHGGVAFYYGERDNEALSIESFDPSGNWEEHLFKIWRNGNVCIGHTIVDNGAKLQVEGEASVSSLAVTGTSTFNGASNFYGSTTFGKENLTMQVNFKCPVVAEDRVTIGGATLRWDDEIKALRLNTSLAATGELSAGGAGTEGGNTGGGGTGTIASPFSRTFTPNEKTSFTFSHDLPYYDVVVQVYEWDSSGMCWNMVLADIEIQNNDVTVTLGRKENVEHKIVVR